MPGPKIIDSDLGGHLPVVFAEIVHRVLVEETGLPDAQEIIEILVCSAFVFRELCLPGPNEVPPGRELATIATIACRVVPANLKLAGGPHEAVGNPALEHRVVIGVGLRRQVECIAVSNAVAREYLAAEGDQREQGQNGQNSHGFSIRHRD